jgi:hypothetical protein
VIRTSLAARVILLPLSLLSTIAPLARGADQPAQPPLATLQTFAGYPSAPFDLNNPELAQSIRFLLVSSSASPPSPTTPPDWLFPPEFLTTLWPSLAQNQTLALTDLRADFAPTATPTPADRPRAEAEPDSPRTLSAALLSFKLTPAPTAPLRPLRARPLPENTPRPNFTFADDRSRPGEYLFIRSLNTAAAPTNWPTFPVDFAPHEAAVDKAWPKQQRFTPAFTLRVDLSALRRRSPDLFTQGPLPRILDSLSLSNTRSLSLIARTIAPADVRLTDPRGNTLPVSPSAPAYQGPPLLTLDLAFTARSEPLNAAARQSIAIPSFPADLSIRPPSSASWAAVIRADLAGPGTARLGGGLTAWSRLTASLFIASGDDSRAHELTITSKMATLTPILRRVTSASSRWLLLFNHNRTLIITSPLREGINPADVAAAITELSTHANAQPFPSPTPANAESPPPGTILSGWTLTPPRSLGLRRISLALIQTPAGKALLAQLEPATTTADTPDQSLTEIQQSLSEAAKSLKTP